MRLRRRKFHVRVELQTGEYPVLLGFGFCTIEATADEARQLAMDIADAIATLQESGGSC
jgi:hypothetical protein